MSCDMKTPYAGAEGIHSISKSNQSVMSHQIEDLVKEKQRVVFPLTILDDRNVLRQPGRILIKTNKYRTVSNYNLKDK